MKRELKYIAASPTATSRPSYTLIESQGRSRGTGGMADLTDEHEQLPPFVHLPHQLPEAVLVLSIEPPIGHQEHQLARRALGANASGRHRKSAAGRLEDKDTRLSMAAFRKVAQKERGSQGFQDKDGIPYHAIPYRMMGWTDRSPSGCTQTARSTR